MPVLLVPSQDPPPTTAAVPARGHMLIPLDGSALAEQVLAPALGLGKLLDMRYTLLQVVSPPAPAVLPPAGEGLTLLEGPARDGSLREASFHLERVAERLRPLSVGTRAVVGPSPAVALLAEAESQAADLIALATHGRGGLKRLLMGSVADKLIRASRIPVLVHHRW
jgi:nucleotide-binding universal stress UspA family protein